MESALISPLAKFIRSGGSTLSDAALFVLDKHSMEEQSPASVQTPGRTSRPTALSREAHQARSFGTTARLRSPSSNLRHTRHPGHVLDSCIARRSISRTCHHSAYHLSSGANHCFHIGRKTCCHSINALVIHYLLASQEHPVRISSLLTQSYIITSCTLRSVGALQCAMMRWGKHHGLDMRRWLKWFYME